MIRTITQTVTAIIVLFMFIYTVFISTLNTDIKLLRVDINDLNDKLSDVILRPEYKAALDYVSDKCDAGIEKVSDKCDSFYLLLLSGKSD